MKTILFCVFCLTSHFEKSEVNRGWGLLFLHSNGRQTIIKVEDRLIEFRLLQKWKGSRGKEEEGCDE